MEVDKTKQSKTKQKEVIVYYLISKVEWSPGLPDGVFSKQKSHFG
jgi:hypothetical protein